MQIKLIGASGFVLYPESDLENELIRQWSDQLPYKTGYGINCFVHAPWHEGELSIRNISFGFKAQPKKVEHTLARVRNFLLHFVGRKSCRPT